MAAKRYIVLRGQIVGNTKNGFQTTYDWNCQFYDTRKAAIKAGWKERGSDDFNIGVVRDGRLIDLAWMNEGGKADADELREIEEEIGRVEGPDHART